MKNIFKLVLLLLIPSFTVTASSIDLEKSSFTWQGSKVTGKHYGKIYLKSADAAFKNNKLKTAEFVMDLTNFTVDDLEGESERKFLKHMKSDDFFEVSKYPTATLKVNSVKSKKMSGDLTIKGITKPVEFEYQVEGNKYSGVLVFDRTKFKMIYGSKNFFKNLGDKVIHNQVKIKFTFFVK